MCFAYKQVQYPIRDLEETNNQESYNATLLKWKEAEMWETLSTKSMK